MLWWTEDLATGVEVIDNQHKSIFKKAEEIISLEPTTDKETINNLFTFLMDYSKNHFNEEEKFMIENVYMGFKEHREEHTYFIEELHEIYLLASIEGNSEDVINRLKLLIINWLVEHINTQDKKFIQTLY